MAKQYIPGVSGLLTEPNPVDAPSNTLTDAENVIVEQGGKVQARHGLNVSELEGLYSPNTIYFKFPSQFTIVSPFLKLLDYKDSSETAKITLFVKQSPELYQYNNTGIYKTYYGDGGNTFCYTMNQNGVSLDTTKLAYSTVTNVFNTRDTLYFQTENGLADANLDGGFGESSTGSIDQCFTNKWPAFPEVSYKLKKSDLYSGWLKAGTKCAIQITFYREMGFTDKPGIVYESEPSVPIIVESLTDNTIPEFYIDFKVDYDDVGTAYQKYYEFTKSLAGRKFGIKIYRTIAVNLSDNIPTEYYQCFPDMPFEKFLGGLVDTYGQLIDGQLYYGFYDTWASTGQKLIELNIGDTVLIGFDDSQPISSVYFNAPIYPYKIVELDSPIKNPLTGTVELANNRILVPDSNFKLGDKIYFNATTTMPSPLVVNTPYYIYDIIIVGSNTYIKVATSRDAFSPITLTTIGSGLQIYTDLFIDSGLQYPSISTYPYRTLPSIVNPNPNNPIYPCKYNTKDRSILKYDYRPARLQVVGKKSKVNPSTYQLEYFYQFKTIENIYNLRLYSVSNPNNGFIPANTVLNTDTLMQKLISNTDTSPLLLRSYIVPLEINDSGIISQPQLYTTPNMDGAGHANIIVPRASNSIKYKDFQVYYGIQKSLTASIFVSTQPLVDQIYFHHSRTGWTSVQGTLNLQPPSDWFYLPNQNTKLPIVGNSETTSKGGSLYMDAPFCGVNDVRLKQFNYTSVEDLSSVGYKNTLRVEPNTILNPIIQVRDSIPIPITDQNILTTYKFVATVYEEGKLTLRLTSTSDVVQTVSIKTYPFYNRRGYYKKYTTKGYFDNKALEFDFSLNEANGIQLTKNQEYAMHQMSNTGKPAITVNASNPMNGKDIYLSETMGHGIFNVVGKKDGQYQSDGRVKGFTVTEADTSRGLFWDKTNGKIVIRADGTLGASSNKFDLKNFDSPGYLLIQYRKSIDGNQKDIDWNTNTTCIFSYSNITQRSNGIYDIIGAKPVNSSLSVLEGLSSTIRADVIIDLFYLPAKSVDSIALYPYSDAPTVRKVTIDLTKDSNNVYGAVLNTYCPAVSIRNGAPDYSPGEDNNSPSQPTFTFHPHQNRSQEPIAVFSNTGNHLFLGANAGYAKSEVELLEEYTYSIINAFNKELRAQDINATLRKGTSAGEITIDYPDGKKVEMRNDYGAHQFYPSIDVDGDTYITLSERYNNEYEEKNKIQWSRRNIPEITTGLLYSYIGKNDKRIIGAAANVDDLYIFKEDGIWRCTDGGNFNAPPREDLPYVKSYLFSNTYICQASGSIQEINDEIIFLSQYGFASIVNGGIQNIGSAIERDILTLISTSPKDRIRSFVNKSKNLYYCTLINESDSSLDVKSGTYIFNTKTRQWSFMDEEILCGIESFDGRNIVAYRQKLTKAKLLGRTTTPAGTRPTFEFTTDVTDSFGRLQRASETTPLDFFYFTIEKFTNNIRNNSVDQYDYVSEYRSKDYMYKTLYNQFKYELKNVEAYPPISTPNKRKYIFNGTVDIALVSNISDEPALGSTVSIVDSFLSLLINRSLYLIKKNSSIEIYPIKVKKTEIVNYYLSLARTFIHFEFIDAVPDWFTSMPAFNNFTGDYQTTYAIVAGIPSRITFNPESGNAPDTNKLFQEYMIHTETNNKGALMSFKTDSRSLFTTDRKFVYDATANNRNVFRTYIPTSVARGRYLIRQIKHDVPLENLIITGQTIVMKDSGSTRVQKDKDNE